MLLCKDCKNYDECNSLAKYNDIRISCGAFERKETEDYFILN